MRSLVKLLAIAVFLLGATMPAAWADIQEIAPGTGLQSAVVVDTGANGLCETTAGIGDIQLAQIGQGSPNRTEIRCGANKTVETTAAGDDVQLVAVGAACKNPNVAVVDTGANGVADTLAGGDDTTVITLGTAPANTPCVITGANGVADTAAASGDDNLLLMSGTAEPNTTVLRCGPNGVADTSANNWQPAGDDVQLIAQGGGCSSNQIVVDSGPNGIAETRAEGPDLVLAVVKPVKVTIPAGSSTGAKTVKFAVSNVEYGAAAPPARGYRLSVTAGSCPGSTVSQVDTDAKTPGIQATTNVPLGGKLKGSFTVTLHLEDITTVSTKIPFRCAVNVTAIALDTDPDEDDAANTDNNGGSVDLEVFDKNDL